MKRWNLHRPFKGARGAPGTGAPGPQGPIGPAGDDGADGAAATISVNSTTTGAPGTNASVTNVGTSNAALLNFVIPRGDQGIQGIQGVQGPPGSDANVPRVVYASGTTGANGQVSFTFSPAFSNTPFVDVELINPTTEQYFRILSRSTTGMTVHVYQRSGLTVLALTVLALATTNVSGATVRIRATET